MMDVKVTFAMAPDQNKDHSQSDKSFNKVVLVHGLYMDYLGTMDSPTSHLLTK